ncbi:MAG: hypothetical protein ACI4U9_01635 [Clostridia bacterium]
MSLLNMLGGQPNNNQGQINNMQNMLKQFNQFKNLMKNKNPKEIVNNMLKDGKINNEQLKQAEDMATQILKEMKN